MNLQTLAIRKRKILVADDDEGIRYLISSPQLQASVQPVP